MSNSILLAFGAMLGMIGAAGLGLWMGSKIKSLKLEIALLILFICCAAGLVLSVPVFKSHQLSAITMFLVYGLGVGIDIDKKLNGK